MRSRLGAHEPCGIEFFYFVVSIPRATLSESLALGYKYVTPLGLSVRASYLGGHAKRYFVVEV
jgi:hypothetical protein